MRGRQPGRFARDGRHDRGATAFTPRSRRPARTLLRSARWKARREYRRRNHRHDETVIEKLASAERDTVAYGRTLSAASGELGGGASPDGCRSWSTGLLGATQAMESRTKTLEDGIAAFVARSQRTRTKLDDVRKESLTDPLTGIRQPQGVRHRTRRRDRAGARTASRSACSCATSITSRSSTTPGAIRPATRCCGSSPLPVGERQGPRHRRALWRRGIRGHPAPHCA
jgi:hypothetical protein